MLTCAIAQEHLLIVGPPGTGKSELVKRFALLCTPAGAANGRVPYFEYLLTRFTEPSEIFGPINIAARQQGKGTRRNTEGMLPHAAIAFFDEIFKANSAILNALLAVLVVLQECWCGRSKVLKSIPFFYNQQHYQNTTPAAIEGQLSRTKRLIKGGAMAGYQGFRQ